MPNPIIICFYRDLRITNNPCLDWAIKNQRQIIPVFIWDSEDFGEASQLWLGESLKLLNQSFNQVQSKLLLYRGNKSSILKRLIAITNSDYVLFNKSPGFSLCKEISQIQFSGNQLLDYDRILNQSGEPYKVFTPFYKAVLNQISSPQHSYILNSSNFFDLEDKDSLDINSLNSELKPWQHQLLQHVRAGERNAQKLVTEFDPTRYKDLRDYPAQNKSSKLSTHLAFGEIAISDLWSQISNPDYRRQLIWREFARYILHHYPQTSQQNFNSKLNNFKWSEDMSNWKLWCQGLTGYPIVDAGMRELWTTGFMHNRVRMITASFLVKNLLYKWQDGAKWFWDTLFDADLANNIMGWQWCAGTGVDPNPYFRIFNPTSQATKFDPDFQYIHQYIPELKDPNSQYPKPILEHNWARQRFLELSKSNHQDEI